MLRTWLQFKRWLRSLLLSLSLKQKINWPDQIDQLMNILKRLPPPHETPHETPDPLPRRKLRKLRIRRRPK